MDVEACPHRLVLRIPGLAMMAAINAALTGFLMIMIGNLYIFG